MNNTRVFTYLVNNILMDALFCGGQLTEIELSRKDAGQILGNVYIGKVKNIVKNIRAAFVEIEGGTLCYLSLEDVKHPIYVKTGKKSGPGHIAEGDELLVQVARDAQKKKPPAVTSNINLTGRYMVLTTGNLLLGYSSKLKKEQKERLKAFVEKLDLPPVGVVMRTKAALAKEAELYAEYEKLLAQYRFLAEQAIHRSVHSCVLKSRPAYLTSVLESGGESLEKIVTDDPKLYREIREFLLEEMPQEADKLALYDDRLLPLKSLYSLDKGLSDAQSRHVWLKSGAYLVFDSTEALTVIDVNSGKCITGKDKEETIRKLNCEAAHEVARQLRLRNLSGIILVDFIDMKSEEEKAGLLELMRGLLKNDPLTCTAVDITALGLMELTRKKQKKTVAEQMRECGI